MVYDIKNKVALITGGASGIGLEYAKELLRNEAKGVVLADLSKEFGSKAVQEIEQEFGPNKAIFVQTDVTDYNQFENAFKKAIEKYKNLDILFNNAGILNDAIWQKEIAVNVNGVVHGMLLGMDNYLPKYKQGDEAVIVNISSTAGIQSYGHMPVYCATKHAVHGMTCSWGVPEFYQETKVRVVGIHPGVTHTPLIFNMAGSNFGGKYEAHLQKHMSEFLTQEPDHVAKEAMNILKKAPHGTSWVIEGGYPAYQFIMPDHRATMRNNILP
ncbi:unnamed protein product [Acanthoscelides obtectus]|uniref:Uncharacterized protein n=2 Tax=Acanthoscelides obtectus TaxID=200917 RepID=A0A9P0KWP3_ACAOB|nr:unnamed protein product [Acanthoscelides obtectus]CAK1635585.1 15-hydroxyprostaglandin dehydrogenase [NAD(+)] [Acanthoscelides obtectus]